MIRRDFLKTIAAFAAAASAGGGVAAASVAEPRVVGGVRELPVTFPAGLDIELIRGEDFAMDIHLSNSVSPWYQVCIDRADHCGAAVVGRVAADEAGKVRLYFDGKATSRLHPGQRPWRLTWGNDRSTSVLVAGTATILPNDLWKAEESVLAIVPQMHPLGIISRCDSYRVDFRAKLRGDEQSRYDDRVVSLVEHCRPVYAEIINRGQGCRIDFAPKGVIP
jgi:hypothetical protein